MLKKCSACGKEFTCTNDETCWCMNYKCSEELLKKLRKDYADCLCEKCFKDYMDNYNKETLTK